MVSEKGAKKSGTKKENIVTGIPVENTPRDGAKRNTCGRQLARVQRLRREKKEPALKHAISLFKVTVRSCTF